jgi:hypothetical protein
MRGSILTLGAVSDKLSQIVGKYWTCIDAAFCQPRDSLFDFVVIIGAVPVESGAPVFR